ncbi:MAG TPA: fumarylacetoacetate hydrolase family protein [Alphaproteobacteria bacterium]|nr:fumarylacetoacetate hydrolase family protein [Alphaproteobacteria bacterium]
MTYVFPPPTPTAVPVDSGGLFPVRRIFCVGRNYAAHAREMGADPDREPPFFFMKPADAIVRDGDVIPFPQATTDLHHEVELVVALLHGGRDVAPERAAELIYGYAVGIDLTRRDLQAAAKAAGRPWDMAKGFDRSAPISTIARRIDGHALDRGAITLAVNGQMRQSADIADMIWPVADTIAHLSRLVELQPGDLIYTGTPEGVGPVKPGETLEAAIDGVGRLTVTIE